MVIAKIIGTIQIQTELGTGGGKIGHCVAVSLEDVSVW
jgi:hypothetical protein